MSSRDEQKLFNEKKYHKVISFDLKAVFNSIFWSKLFIRPIYSIKKNGTSFSALVFKKSLLEKKIS